MPKKKLTKLQPHDQRIQKARQWLTTYTGTPKKIIKHYRQRFHLDINTAISDLQESGIEFTQEYLDAVKKSEEARIRQKQLKQAEKKQAEYDALYEDSDETFAFIAGYTSGGVPYGTTWQELGLEPFASAEEIEAAYKQQDEDYMPSVKEKNMEENIDIRKDGIDNEFFY